jgi:type IV pilus assembly protein PilV
MKSKHYHADKNMPGFYKSSSHARAISGFSLVEVLVALLVLSIGLLGLASLQTFGLRYNQQSYQRTQAVYQAYDVVDRIRANPVGMANTCYDTVAAGATAVAGACAGAFKNCESNTCTPNELANYDINKWNTANQNLLSQGRGAISTSNVRRTVTISWIENELPASFVLEVDL